MRAQDVLADETNELIVGGVAVRKGSVGAFLANAAALRDPSVTGPARAQVLRDIEALLPGLRAIGLFDVFEVKDPELRGFVDAHPGGSGGDR